MMNYLIMRTDTRSALRFVAPPGSPQSYTTKGKARRYLTREAADADRCPENEIVVHVNAKET